jgi:hypothetical protein
LASFWKAGEAKENLKQLFEIMARGSRMLQTLPGSSKGGNDTKRRGKREMAE